MNGTSVSLDCHLLTGNCGLSATLDVPADTPVDLDSGGGNMQASGIQRDVTLDSAGGDVTLSGIGGDTDLSTGGGNVNARDLGGIMQFLHRRRRRHRQLPVLPHVKLVTGGGNVTLAFTKRADLPEDHQQRGRHQHGAPAWQHPATPSRARPRAATTAPRCRSASSSRHTITVNSGGGNVSIAES